MYTTNKTFNEIDKLITNAIVNMNYITVYFGDNLFDDEQSIIRSDRTQLKSGELVEYYLTRDNLISKFHLESNKYMN